MKQDIIESNGLIADKQEAIKTEWVKLVGEDNFGRLRIDDNGWSNWHCRKLMPNTYFGALQDKARAGAKYPVSGIDILYRPKSLKGIDNNNGWNKIYTRKDLPKKEGTYLFLVDGREIEQYVEEGVSFGRLHTHWREIVPIPRPLY